MRYRALLGVGAFLLVPLLLRGQSDDEPHGDLAIDCGDCHDAEKWVPVDEPPLFRHEQTGFALLAAHAKLSCRRCHKTLVFDRVGAACADCHEDAHRGELGFRCESCHTPTTWTNQREMFQAHSRTRFPLLSIHARLDCTACHRNQRPYQFANTPAECGACHHASYLETTSPSHVQAGFSTRCEDCHLVTAATWRGARFSHPERFPLRGGHAGLSCARCHFGGIYAGLSTACVSCHQVDYAGTANPNHQASGFPTTCEDCHTIDGWRPARFDHNLTRFPLTGAHLRLECRRCHEGGRYTGTPTDCFACHQADYAGTTNPNHPASGFPTDCQSCHTTNAWRPATFDHGRTRFPLTGAHLRLDCSRCHEGGRYAGTPTDCYACHQSEYAATTYPNHQASGFPTDCRACHSTDAWRPASFNHDASFFPIYSGTHAGEWSSCSDCHVSSGNYGVFECIFCHPHSNQAQTDAKHRRVSNYSYVSAACYRCHRDGRADALFSPSRLDRTP